MIMIIITFNACSSQNAFSNFKLSHEEEQSVLSLQSSKIISNKNITGIFSAIYLNKINANKYSNYETFYISLYLKKEDKKINFMLNNNNAFSVKELDVPNEFSNLFPINNQWYKYYLVKFEKDKTSQLNLSLETNNAKTQLMFKKKSN